MGNLTPGAKLIYERVDDTVYAREFGKIERIEVGRMYSKSNGENIDSENFIDRYHFGIQWYEILRAAKNNSALQEALERVKILYYLTDKND